MHETDCLTFSGCQPQNANSQKKEATERHRIVFFRKLAEIASQYLKKGAQVYVEGALKTRKWQDQSGQDRYTTEIVADNMKMLGGKRDGEQSAPRSESAPAQNQQRSAPAQNSGGAFADMEDDIPFAPIGRKMAMVI